MKRTHSGPMDDVVLLFFGACLWWGLLIACLASAVCWLVRLPFRGWRKR